MISDEQRARRRNHIGSSDVAAIVGLCPYRSAADVYISKVHEQEDAVHEWHEAGNRLESCVMDWMEETQQVSINRDIEISTPGEVLSCNLDGMVHGDNDVVEAKTTGIVGPIQGLWGDEMTDQVPRHILIQCQHQMGVVGTDVAWVPALIGGRGFTLYRINRNDKLISVLQSRCLHFWNEYVKRRRLPTDCPPPRMDLLKSVVRDDSAEFVMPLPDDPIDRYIEFKDMRLLMEKEEERAKREVLAYMGDASHAEWSGGTVTYKMQARKGGKGYRVLRVKPL